MTRTIPILKMHGHTTIKGDVHMTASIFLICTLALGYLAGIFSKGITITVNHNDKSKELPITEDGSPQYNKSYEDLADPEVRAYLEQNHGQYKL